MKPIAGAALWVAAGHLVLAGLFWLLLRVPESNVVTLATSAALVVLILVGAAAAQGVAVMLLDATADRRAVAMRIPSAIVAFIAAAGLFCAIWWLTARASRWLAVHGGEIDAWLVMHFNFTRTARLHAALAWALTIIRYVLGLSVAAAVVASGTVDGVRSLVRASGWAKRALSPLRLAAIASCWAALLWLPWVAVDWRPRALPIAIEPVFVAAKLAVLYLVMNLGIALILRIQLPGRLKPSG